MILYMEKKIILRTDHKPLEIIFGPKKRYTVDSSVETSTMGVFSIRFQLRNRVDQIRTKRELRRIVTTTYRGRHGRFWNRQYEHTPYHGRCENNRPQNRYRRNKAR